MKTRAMSGKNVFILFGILIEALAAYGAFTVIGGYRRDEHVWRTFLPTPARVTANMVRRHSAGRGRVSYQYAVTYRYDGGGREYESSRLVGNGVWFDAFQTEEEARQRVAGEYPVGRQVTAYYDPDDPADAVLVRHEPSMGGLICPAGFALLGVPGCAYGLVVWMRKRGQTTKGEGG